MRYVAKKYAVIALKKRSIGMKIKDIFLRKVAAYEMQKLKSSKYGTAIKVYPKGSFEIDGNMRPVNVIESTSAMNFLLKKMLFTFLS